jgi:hypothetical protein
VAIKLHDAKLRICVFCDSRSSIDVRYQEVAAELGGAIVDLNLSRLFHQLRPRSPVTPALTASHGAGRMLGVSV